MFVVIFEVLPAEGRRDDYLAHAKELKPVLEAIDGFIDNERFESRRRAGRVLSLSTWRDEKSLIRWRTETRHHLTQQTGRDGVFADYHLRVAEVTADDRPSEGGNLRQHRFDTTETGASTACSVVELTPQDGTVLPPDAALLLQDVGLADTTPGLVELDVFDSIYIRGKALVLASWAEAAQADAFQPAIPAAAVPRHRTVRVIRDYGMFDRRETPQYFPPAVRA